MHSFIVDPMFMSEWYFTKPWLYFGVYLVIIMICGGILALCSLLISFIAKNTLIISVFPFILCVSLDYILMELDLTMYSISRIINPMSADAKYNMNIQNIIVAGIFLLAMCIFGFLWTGYRRKKII